MGVQVVWFKRDLRVQDHEALLRATKSGLTIPLYVFEPDLWVQPDMSGRQFSFLNECLVELDRDLQALGQPLVYRTGDVVAVLEGIHHKYTIDALWSHQETWNGWTYKRDIAVKSWCRARNITWHEPLQYGVHRAMPSRAGWAARWDRMMDRPVWSAPERVEGVSIDTGNIPELGTLGISPDRCRERQTGGRSVGMALLASFLASRGRSYQIKMSSPVDAYDACSRISPYMSFGVLSMREAYQAALEKRRTLTSFEKEESKEWAGSIRAFIGRLHWHCHFIQKLEDEPALEFQSLHPDMEGLREPGFDHALLEAWKLGQTGFPMVDACMRALIETGWLNFRMRAMLVSFAVYQLWIPWREIAVYLARLFVDYEPGIHYSQCQMQSGATGTNAIRIYNPIKQGIEQDPQALFIREWVPELRSISPARIHDVRSIHQFAPDYPAPIVDEKAARKVAAETIFEIRSGPEFKRKAQQILQKYGLRKSGMRRTLVGFGAPKKSKPKGKKSNQIELPF